MRTKTLRSVANGALSFAVFLLTVIGADRQFQGLLGLKPRVFDALLLLSLACMGIALIFYLLTPFDLERSYQMGYSLERVRRDKIPILHRFCVDCLGEMVSTEAKMLEWFDRNPNIFFGLYKERKRFRGNRRKLVGYFCVLPVLKPTIERLLDGRLKGIDFTGRDIASPRGRPAGYYIGGVAAVGRDAKAEILVHLFAHIAHRVTRTGVNLVLARPISKDGMRLVKRYGLAPIPAGPANPFGVVHSKHLTNEITL